MLEIRIAKPCDQTWTAMKGDEQVRHCGACRKNVYNIAAMTEKEVEDLIRRTEGRFCARIYRRTDGRVLTADCPRGVASVRRRRTLAVSAAFAAVAGVLYPIVRPATLGATRTYVRPHDTEHDPPMTGKIAMSEATLGEVVDWSGGSARKEGFETGQAAFRVPSKDERYNVQRGAPEVASKHPN